MSKVPYEQLRKAFRSTQRNFERDFVQLTSNAADASKSSTEGGDVSAQVIALDAMISRVRNLKKRVSKVFGEPLPNICMPTPCDPARSATGYRAPNRIRLA